MEEEEEDILLRSPTKVTTKTKVGPIRKAKRRARAKVPEPDDEEAEEEEGKAKGC